MTFELKVVVLSPDYHSKEKRCSGLGHQFYRCGNCRNLIKVFSKDKHDAECSNCGWKVYVEYSRRDGK